jgi:protein-S-isoprenylcysteine O-methyltransferase Ste14
VNAPAFFARWRVRLGYPLAIVVLILARPTPKSIFYGALVGIVGLLVRAMAAGHLHKQAVLTVTGPYAYTRNPLYLGSAILTLGAAIATHSWISAILLLGYFALFYSIVMHREEQELRFHHGASFDEYARSVPLFVPRLTPANLAGSREGAFSFAQYKKNREYRAAIGFLLLLVTLLAIWRFRSTSHFVSAESIIASPAPYFPEPSTAPARSQAS